MPDLDPRAIIAQRPLPTLADMQDEQQKRQIQEQEVELRRQEIMARRDAIVAAAQAQSQKAAAPALDPAKQMEASKYRVFQAEQLADTLDRVTKDPSLYPYAKQHIAATLGDDVANTMPPEYDPEWTANTVAVGRKAIAAEKSNLVPVDTVNDAGEPVRRFVEPTPNLEVPLAPKSATTKVANLGSFEDYMQRTYGAEPTSAQILEGRKKYNQADDKATGGALAGTSLAATGGLDPDGLELAGAKYRITGQTLSRDHTQNAAIANEAAKQGKLLGNSPVQTIQRQAAYSGDAKALAKMQAMSASAEAFENKANAQTSIIRDLSAKVPRTSFPIINSALQAGRTEIKGDTNATQLANAIETFSEEYAKIMNGATGSSAAASDSSRAAAKRLINTAMSKGTMNDVLALMQREMNLTMQGYAGTIDHITTRMGGAPAAPAAPAAVTPTLRFNPATGKAEAIK